MSTNIAEKKLGNRGLNLSELCISWIQKLQLYTKTEIGILLTHCLS